MQVFEQVIIICGGGDHYILELEFTGRQPEFIHGFGEIGSIKRYISRTRWMTWSTKA